MALWTPEQWIVFFTGLGGFIASVATVWLQLRGNAKTSAAKKVSEDNNEKLTATVAQIHEIARAVPKASTAPTDDLVNNDPATNARKAGL